MKKLIIIVLIITGSVNAKAQILAPVKWAYAAKKTNAATATLFLKATIDDGWHIYSVYQPEGGPVKTSFEFTKDKAYDLVGRVTEPKPIIKFEKAFEIDVKYFASSVIFQQKIRLKNKTAVVKGKLRFMVCNDRKCLPPEIVNFIIPVK